MIFCWKPFFSFSNCSRLRLAQNAPAWCHIKQQLEHFTGQCFVANPPRSQGVVGVSAAYAKMAQSGLGARPVNISGMALSLTHVIFSWGGNLSVIWSDKVFGSLYREKTWNLGSKRAKAELTGRRRRGWRMRRRCPTSPWTTSIWTARLVSLVGFFYI